MDAKVNLELLTCSDGLHKIAVATLDNPASLNALSLSMLEQLKSALETWQSDDLIVAVLLEGAGEKAFCAGGDVRTMHKVMKERSKNEAMAFCSNYFSTEYQCDYLIHTYSKPIIAWGEGIIMGGGMGLYMGASHKVVTPRSRLAMPEISIGLYPDVGGTWFLNRLTKGMGMFLGLTGASINSSDALALQMGDYCLLAEQRATLLEQLQISPWLESSEHHELVCELLDELSVQALSQMPPAQIAPYVDEIEAACSSEKLTTICQNIQALQAHSEPEKWLTNAKANLASGSPISGHICFRQIRHYHDLSLADCFRLELGLSVQCGLLGEFQEGVRARLIDKTGEPDWLFTSIEEVDESVIDSLFTSLWLPESHPLAQLGK